MVSRGCEREARWLALLLAVALAAAAEDSMMSQLAPAPFLMNSRYGRSGPRMMSPRNDKFFMGSRYGKRSEPETMTPLELPPAHVAQAGHAAPTAAAGALLCDYTGVASLYRCHSTDRLHRRSTEGWSSEED